MPIHVFALDLFIGIGAFYLGFSKRTRIETQILWRNYVYFQNLISSSIIQNLSKTSLYIIYFFPLIISLKKLIKQDI